MFFKKNNETSRLRALAQRNGAFNSKAAAFDYFFITEGLDVEEADRLATAIVSARGVPEVAEKPKNFVDNVKYVFGTVNEITNEYPKATDFVVGAITGVLSTFAGVAFGKKSDDGNSSESPKYEIDSTAEPLEINEQNINEITEIPDETTPI